jgi:hypothetical protein
VSGIRGGVNVVGLIGIRDQVVEKVLIEREETTGMRRE